MKENDILTKTYEEKKYKGILTDIYHIKSKSKLQESKYFRSSLEKFIVIISEQYLSEYEVEKLQVENIEFKRKYAKATKELRIHKKVEKMRICQAILKDRKDRKLEKIATITAECDANIIMLALHHLGSLSYTQLTKYVEKASTIYKHIAGLEKVSIIKMERNKFKLTTIGRHYLSMRGITAQNPFSIIEQENRER